MAAREVFDWHDHRIHWMSRELPPKIRANRNRAQHVFDWTVPATLLVVLAGGTAIWLRRRREGRAV